jgi:hypothetical protein
MNSLRQYLDILAEADAPAPTNPWEGKDPAKAEAWAKLSPQTQQKIGMADPTDEILVSNNVKGGFFFGKPVTDANPDGTPKVAAAPAPAAAPATPAEPPVAQQAAPLKTPSAGASADGNAGETDALAAATPGQSGMTATPKNRDSMTFGQAFADARGNKETTFPWRGKKYSTELAKPKVQQPSGITTQPQQGAMPKPVDPAAKSALTNNPWTAEETAQYNDILKRVQSAKTQGEKDMANAEMVAWSQRVGKRMSGMSGPAAATESVGYAEDQNLVSIIHLAGLK